MEIKLTMPKTEMIGNNGISDGNIETYKNKPMISLTKEELQNSTDNAIENGGKSIVKVEFSCFDVDRNKIPDVDKLVNVFKDERSYWDDYLENDKKPVEFFDEALKLLEGETVRCLRISDFNTTGLSGVCSKKSSPWQNLVMNKGVSDKPGKAGGSFGIGKDAAFACSKLRMVFYNTINTDEENNKAFQGVIKLPSYRKENINYDGTGYFGKVVDDDYGPIFDSISLEEGYSRREVGMDKFIIGFYDNLTSEEIKEQIIISSINNFLYAFWNGTLEIKYGETLVNKDTLGEIFSKYEDRKELNTLTKEYYDTLLNPHKKIFVSLFEEDDVTIYTRVESGLSRRAAIVRQSGMKVFDRGYISSRIEFSSVVVLTGNLVNKYFKKLENSEHTAWEIERATNKTEAQNKINIILDGIKEVISELRADQYTEQMDADGLGEYLPSSYTTGNREKIDALTNTIEPIEEKKKQKIKKKRMDKKEKPEDEIVYEKDEDGNIIENTIEVVSKFNNENPFPLVPGPKSNDNPDIFSPNEEGEEERGKPIDNRFVSSRIVALDNLRYSLNKEGKVYSLKFIPSISISSGFFEIKIAGEIGSYSTIVHKAKLNDNVTAENKNKIYVNNILKDTLNKISFEISNDGEWALEVVLHEN